MKKFLSLIFSVVIISFFALDIYAAESVPKKVLEQTDSVVRIISEYKDGYSTGTGFVIKNDMEGTFIVTNNHVVEENPDSIYIFVDEETIYADVVAKTSQKDMAVLKLEYSISAEPLKLASDSAQRGDAVYAAGFPGASDSLTDNFAYKSEDVTITDGIVSAVREFTLSGYGTAVKMLQINAAINSGNSGGPLFNAKGEVVGINTLEVTDSQGVFASIDVSELRIFLDSNGIKTNQFDFGVLRITAAGLAALLFILIVKKDLEKAKKLIPEKNIHGQEDIIEISIKTDNGRYSLKFPEFKLPKLNVKKIIIVAAVIAVIIVAGVHIGTISYAKTEDFVESENVIILPTVKYIDLQLYRYMQSAKLMTTGEFDDAKEKFEEMSGYLYADIMIYEADYRKAAYLADSDEFSAAVTVYRNLDKKGYKDSAEKLIETKYRQGMYMYEKGSYYSALKVLDELRAEYEPAENAFAEIQLLWIDVLLTEENYLKAYEIAMLEPNNLTGDIMSGIKECVYMQGQMWYRKGSYENAKDCFEMLGEYKDSKTYLSVIKSVDFFNSDSAEETVYRLKEMFYFENVCDILLSNQDFAQEFLKGRWTTEDGIYSMVMGENGAVSIDLPMLKGYENCYYYIENGEYKVFFEDAENYKVAYHIKAITVDSIGVECYADNTAYILYRR